MHLEFESGLNVLYMVDYKCGHMAYWLLPPHLENYFHVPLVCGMGLQQNAENTSFCLVCLHTLRMGLCRHILYSFKFLMKLIDADCEWKAQAGNVCVASFDWTCSGICRSADRIKEVHRRCGEGENALWSASFWEAVAWTSSKLRRMISRSS